MYMVLTQIFPELLHMETIQCTWIGNFQLKVYIYSRNFTGRNYCSYQLGVEFVIWHLPLA